MILSTNYGLYFFTALAFFFALRGGKKEKKAVILMLLGYILTFFALPLIHIFIKEPRPFTTYHFKPLITPPTSLSFPSGHSTIMAVITSAFLFTRSRWMALFFIFMLWIGFSRIYVGVHYPLDVLGGFILGFIISFTIGYAINKLYRYLKV